MENPVCCLVTLRYHITAFALLGITIILMLIQNYYNTKRLINWFDLIILYQCTNKLFWPVNTINKVKHDFLDMFLEVHKHNKSINNSFHSRQRAACDLDFAFVCKLRVVHD